MGRTVQSRKKEHHGNDRIASPAITRSRNQKIPKPLKPKCSCCKDDTFNEGCSSLIKDKRTRKRTKQPVAKSAKRSRKSPSRKTNIDTKLLAQSNDLPKQVPRKPILIKLLSRGLSHEPEIVLVDDMQSTSSSPLSRQESTVDPLSLADVQTSARLDVNSDPVSDIFIGPSQRLIPGSLEDEITEKESTRIDSDSITAKDNHSSDFIIQNTTPVHHRLCHDEIPIANSILHRLLNDDLYANQMATKYRFQLNTDPNTPPEVLERSYKSLSHVIVMSHRQRKPLNKNDDIIDAFNYTFGIMMYVWNVQIPADVCSVFVDWKNYLREISFEDHYNLLFTKHVMIEEGEALSIEELIKYRENFFHPTDLQQQSSKNLCLLHNNEISSFEELCDFLFCIENAITKVLNGPWSRTPTHSQSALESVLHESTDEADPSHVSYSQSSEEFDNPSVREITSTAVVSETLLTQVSPSEAPLTVTDSSPLKLTSTPLLQGTEPTACDVVQEGISKENSKNITIKSEFNEDVYSAQSSPEVIAYYFMPSPGF